MHTNTNITSARSMGALALAMSLFFCSSAWAKEETGTDSVAGKKSWVLAKESKLWLEGDSTLHRYKLTSTELQCSVGLKEAAREGATTPLQVAERGLVQSFSLVIPVVSLQSGDGSLDENMRRAVKSKEHPTVVFTMESYSTKKVATSTVVDVTVRGTLTVAGVAEKLEIKARATQEGDVLRIRGQRELYMSDYGVKAPVLFLGAIKTDDRITVGFDLGIQEIEQLASRQAAR